MSHERVQNPHPNVTRDVRVIIVMGVAGAGKTTVAQALAHRLGWLFVEGDGFHPAANIAAMAAGHPLDDVQRAPWLAAIRGRIDEVLASGQRAVIACSALRHSYRRVLIGDDAEAIRLVHLEVPPDELRRRLEQRHGHFMPPDLLDSQLETLEPSRTAIVVDGSRAVDAIIAEIVERIF
jgi:gluconokinase